MKTDGTLWAWGSNAFGQVGNGSSGGTVGFPQQIGLDFVSVAAGESHSLALKTDGSLGAWRANFTGQVGDGTSGATILSPVQVASGIAAVAAGAYHSVALKTDGTLWGWGLNQASQVGNPSLGLYVKAPVQLGSGVRRGRGRRPHRRAQDRRLGLGLGSEPLWPGRERLDERERVPGRAGGLRLLDDCRTLPRTVAVKADGTLWFWGDDAYGEIWAPVVAPWQMP